MTSEKATAWWKSKNCPESDNIFSPNAADSTLASITAKRFQRSNSRNCKAIQIAVSPDHTHNKIARPTTQPSNSQKNEISSGQATFRPASPQEPSHYQSLLSPQYIKMNKTSSNAPFTSNLVGKYPQRIESFCNDAQSVNEKENTGSGNGNLKEWKTEFKKVSDLPSSQHAFLSKQNFNTINHQYHQKSIKKSSESGVLRVIKDIKVESYGTQTEETQNINSWTDKITILESRNLQLSQRLELMRKQKDDYLQQYQNLKRSFAASARTSTRSKIQEQINRAQSFREVTLNKQVQELQDELSFLKSDRSSSQMQKILTDLREENQNYKKQLQTINLRCRMLEQQNAQLGHRSLDERKMYTEVKYLKVCLEDCYDQIDRLKGQNKKLRKREADNLDPCMSRIGFGSDTDSLNLSMSWKFEK